MYARLVIGLTALAVLTSCAHPNRVSSRELQRLTNNRATFVLVFGSLSTPRGMLARPVIRFVNQANSSSPENLLWSLVISSGDRFYAVLPTPQGMSYLDQFYAEVGSATTGFDRIAFVRLHRDDGLVAMYFGEILMQPAKIRNAQGQMVTVSIRDDFPNAERELRRLYPHFDGKIIRWSYLK